MSSCFQSQLRTVDVVATLEFARHQKSQSQILIHLQQLALLKGEKSLKKNVDELSFKISYISNFVLVALAVPKDLSPSQAACQPSKFPFLSLS